MRRSSRIVVTIAALVTAFVPLVADLNRTHMWNPEWPPHARYHGWVFLIVNVVAGLVSLWLLYGPASRRDPTFALRVAAFLPALCWGPQLIAVLVPGASSWPDGLVTRPPLPVAGNVFLSAIVLVLCGVGASPGVKLDGGDRR
jgi:hypothetical protein